MEGYTMGLDKRGQFFVSVTTSNYPFSYIDKKYAVCTSNTIFLKTNLNNIGVSNTGIVAKNIVLSEEEPFLTDRIGCFQGVMPDGEFHRRMAVIHGYDGRVLAFGHKELDNEEHILYSSFSSYIRHHLYSDENSGTRGDGDDMNIVDTDSIYRYLNDAQNNEVDTSRVNASFINMFIPAQVSSFGISQDPIAFHKSLLTIC
jgi:hypothetical protein